MKNKRHIEGTKIEDLTGEKIGLLTVTGLDYDKTFNDEENNKHKSWWIVKCQCGMIKSVKRSYLMSKGVLSCGCVNKKGEKLILGTKIKDLTNKVFGRLTVLALSEKNTAICENDKRSGISWVCRCSCGKITTVLGSSLQIGHTKSCGCLNVETSREVGLRRAKTNVYDLKGDYGIGYTNKGEEFYFDLEDYKKIKDYCWYIDGNGYPSAKIRGYADKRIMLHKLITDTDGSQVVDHINKHKNDCKKSNLRLTTQRLNSMNIGKRCDRKYVGVYKREYGSYNAYLSFNGKGFKKAFKTEEEALIQRLKWEFEFFGEFSPQIHLFEKYGIPLPKINSYDKEIEKE